MTDTTNQLQPCEKPHIEVTSMMLHIMAMLFMLLDHMWATVVNGNDWMTCIGRIAFPIFAFMIVEGYFHTHNLKKYVLRMLVFAVLSEIPFNLVMASTVFYPLHQNVLWTFLIGIFLIYVNEKAKAKGKLWLRAAAAAGTILLGFILGIVTFVDYNCAGVLTVLTFYFFRGRTWQNFLCQFVVLAYINIEMLSGFAYELNIFGGTVYFERQAFALLALIPIWLYRGKQGPYNKPLKYLYYSFYPVHLLILAMIVIIN